MKLTGIEAIDTRTEVRLTDEYLTEICRIYKNRFFPAVAVGMEADSYCHQAAEREGWTVIRHICPGQPGPARLLAQDMIGALWVVSDCDPPWVSAWAIRVRAGVDWADLATDERDLAWAVSRD